MRLLGTGDAVLSARNVVDTPFAILNADDFYGAEAFSLIHDSLSLPDYSMVAYDLFNTLSDNGGVSRGVCKIENGFLTGITETHGIEKTSPFPKNTPVSMNLWGLKPDIFDILDDGIVKFLQTAPDIRKNEYLIPTVIGELATSGQRRVVALRTSAVWFGMTYREDKAAVQASIPAAWTFLSDNVRALE